MSSSVKTNFLLLLLIQVYYLGTYSLAEGPEEKLVSRLLKQNRLKVRPSGSTQSGPIIVNITYNVIQILGFSQAEETLSISGWFTIIWKDPRLLWEPEDSSNITEVLLSAAEIWLPDVGVMNSKSSREFDFSNNVLSRLTVTHDGVITWLHGTVMDITCPLDVRYFPFDQQVCYIIVTPWQSPINHLRIQPFSSGPTVDNSYLPNSNVSEWEIKEVQFFRKEYKSQLNFTYQYISIGIHIERQPLYFIVLVLVPFSMLSFLACLIFTLDDTGDRLSVALSLVLSMTMYVVIVSSNAPRSMRNLPVLVIYLLDQLGLLSVATVLAVINNKLRFHHPRVEQLLNTPIGRRFRPPGGFPHESMQLRDSPIQQLRSPSSKSPLCSHHLQHENGETGTPLKSLSSEFVTTPKSMCSNGKSPHRSERMTRSRYGENSKKYFSSVPTISSLNPFPYQNTSPIVQDVFHLHNSCYIYKSLADKMDQAELLLYLLLSAVNAGVCLIITPRIAQHPSLT